MRQQRERLRVTHRRPAISSSGVAPNSAFARFCPVRADGKSVGFVTEALDEVQHRVIVPRRQREGQLACGT